MAGVERSEPPAFVRTAEDVILLRLQLDCKRLQSNNTLCSGSDPY